MEVFNSSSSTQPGVVVLIFDKNKRLNVKFEYKMSISVILYKDGPHDDENQSTPVEEAYRQPLSTVLQTTKGEDDGGQEMVVHKNIIDFQDFDETALIDLTDILMDPVIESNSTISSSENKTQQNTKSSPLEKTALSTHIQVIDRDKDKDGDNDFQIHTENVDELSHGDCMVEDPELKPSDDLVLDHYQKSVSIELPLQQSENLMFTEEIKTLNNLSCQICEKIFQSNEEIIEHGTVIISKEKCPKCQEECMSKANLLLHDFLLHKDGGKVCPECPICMVPFLDNLEVINHLKFRHTKEEAYKCCMCLKVFQDYYDFREHLDNFRLNKSCNGTRLCRPHTKKLHAPIQAEPVKRMKKCGIPKDSELMKEISVSTSSFLPVIETDGSDSRMDLDEVVETSTNQEYSAEQSMRNYAPLTFLKHIKDERYKQVFQVVGTSHYQLHPGIYWHKCDICERLFKSSRKRRDHIQPNTLVEFCKKCGWEAYSKAEYLLHEYIRHSEEYQKDKCPVCKKICSNADVLNHVMEKHTDECPYICCICDMPLQNVELYTLHVQNHQNLATAYNTESSVDKLFSNKLSFKYTGNNDDEDKTVCRLCKEKFESQQDFIHHCQNKTVKKACDDCDTVTFTEAGYIVHRCLSHGSSLEDSNSLAIPPCNDSSNNISKEDRFDECSNGGPPRVKCPCCADIVNFKDLCFHVMERHTREYPFRCCTCNNECMTIDAFVDHCNYHLGKKVHDSESPRCSRCNLQFESRQAIKDHQGIWHKSFTCSLCQIDFGNTCLLDEHLHSAHKDEIKACSFCEKVFCNSLSLAWHERNHYYEKRVTCHICGESKGSKRALRNHMQRLHSDNQNDIRTLCAICGKLVHQGSIAAHFASHSDDRPHACSFCVMTFKSRRSVQNHVKCVHMKHIRSYICDVCGKMSSTPHNLRIHMRIHSSEKAFSCSFCGQGFNYNQSLQAHITKKHK